MPDYFKEARKALNEGDYQKAGDCYALAGDVQSAVDSYTTGGHYAVAARLLERNDDIRRAAQYYAQASIFDKAATLYLRVEDYRNASLTFEKSGDFTRAADMAAKSSDFARAAMMAEQANQLDKAAQYYNQIQNYQRAAEIYEKLLIKNIRERTGGEFLESVHNAIKKYGTNAGNLYFKLKQFDKAAKCFEDASNYAKCAESLAQLGHYSKAGEMYAKADDFKNASELYEKANNIPKAVQMAERSNNLERAAMLSLNSGYPEKAASYLVRIKKLDKAAEIYYNLMMEAINGKSGAELTDEQRVNMKKYGTAAGNVYYKLKNYSKAAWCYEQGETFAKAAECYMLINDPAKAGELYYRAQYYDKAYELLTSPAVPVSDPGVLADVCFYTKRYSEAGDLYVAANRRDRAAEAYELSTNMYKAALLYEDTGNIMKAADIYSTINEPARAANLYEKSGMHAEAAAYYESAGMFDRATECYLKIGEKNRAAITMARQGKLEEAAPLLQQIKPDDSEYSEACLMLGEFFANKGMESLALQKFNEVIGSESLSKSNVDLHYRLAGVYEKLGNKEKAQEVYEKIMLLQMNYRDVFEKLQNLKASETTPVPETLEPATQPTTTPVPTSESGEAAAAAIPQENLVGRRVREYEILDLVGKGGMSVVYRARHVYLNKERAIKIIQTDLADAFFSDRFIQEARILADLHNRHLVQLFEFGSLEGNQMFMVLEWIQGESVKQRVQRMGRIGVTDSIRIVREAARGLYAAHEKGIIHRDISPDNLMLVDEVPGKEITKLIDFGIAKSAREHTHTRANLFLGKPQYASPEQCGFLKEGEVLDARSDLYSLGITFYYMLTGKSPFHSPTPQGYLVKHISQKPKPLAEQLPIYESPELLDELIFKTLEAERSKRHSSVSEFLDHMDDVVKRRK